MLLEMYACTTTEKPGGSDSTSALMFTCVNVLANVQDCAITCSGTSQVPVKLNVVATPTPVSRIAMAVSMGHSSAKAPRPKPSASIMKSCSMSARR